MFDIQLMGLLNATLQAATLLFIAALGELITEKSWCRGHDINWRGDGFYDCNKYW